MYVEISYRCNAAARFGPILCALATVSRATRLASRPSETPPGNSWLIRCISLRLWTTRRLPTTESARRMVILERTDSKRVSAKSSKRLNRGLSARHGRKERQAELECRASDRERVGRALVVRCIDNDRDAPVADQLDDMRHGLCNLVYRHARNVQAIDMARGAPGRDEFEPHLV